MKLIFAIVSLVWAATGDKIYTLKNLNLLAPDCFAVANNEVKSSVVRFIEAPYEFGTSEQLKISIQSGFFCTFTSYGNFKVSPNSGSDRNRLKIYYLPYKGYAPAIKTGKDSCKFVAEDFLYEGALDEWFLTNAFGGACGFFVLIGVPQEE